MYIRKFTFNLYNVKRIYALNPKAVYKLEQIENTTYSNLLI